MKVSEVSEQDLRHMHQLSTLMNTVQCSVGWKDLTRSGDAVRWLQNLVQDMAKAFSQKPSEKPEGEPVPPSVPVESKPSEPGLPGLGDVKIKAYNPGKPGKK